MRGQGRASGRTGPAARHGEGLLVVLELGGGLEAIEPLGRASVDVARGAVPIEGAPVLSGAGGVVGVGASAPVADRESEKKNTKRAKKA